MNIYNLLIEIDKMHFIINKILVSFQLYSEAFDYIMSGALYESKTFANSR